LCQLNEKQVDVLLLSPEAVISGYVGGDMFMKHLAPVAFACIDEVHCISEWSHNFRPSYLQLCKVMHENMTIL
jgi:ATP-dependent DNA helicase Q4